MIGSPAPLLLAPSVTDVRLGLNSTLDLIRSPAPVLNQPLSRALIESDVSVKLVMSLRENVKQKVLDEFYAIVVRSLQDGPLDISKNYLPNFPDTFKNEFPICNSENQNNYSNAGRKMCREAQQPWICTNCFKGE